MPRDFFRFWQGVNPVQLALLAETLGLEYRVFDLEHAAAMLTDIAVVLHCAGPFAVTSASMRLACRQAGAHYLDITGELSVFEQCHAEADAARRAGTVICAGVGFDVIPTDCIAACLHDALPDATHLTVGLTTVSPLSRGTKMSGLGSLRAGSVVRVEGRLLRIPFGLGRRELTINGTSRSVAPLPFGDLVTAWYDTGIPNIEVLAPLGWIGATALRLLGPLLQRQEIYDLVFRIVGKQAAGPSQVERDELGAYVWGQAVSSQGCRYSASVTTSNVYEVTVHGSLLAVRTLLSYEGPGGYFTPSQVLGHRCVEKLPGSSRIALTAVPGSPPQGVRLLSATPRD